MFKMPLERKSQTKLPNGDRMIVYEEYHLKQIIVVVIDKEDRTVAVTSSAKTKEN